MTRQPVRPLTNHWPKVVFTHVGAGNRASLATSRRLTNKATQHGWSHTDGRGAVQTGLNAELYDVA